MASHSHEVLMVRSLFLVLAVVLTTSMSVRAHSNHDHVKLECNVKKAVEKGKYDWVHGFFVEGAPEAECKQGKESNTELFIFEKEVDDPKDIQQKMADEGCRPANHFHLLGLGATHVKTVDSQDPQPRMNNPIVALGSVWTHESGSHSVPALTGERGKNGYVRELTLQPTYALQNDKYQHWIYLAVCNRKNK